MRKIFLTTERRADYSRFKPILKLIHDDPDLKYDLVVTGLHLSKKHGHTIDDIKKDGFNIFSKFEMFKEDVDTPGAMVRAYAEATRQLTFEIEKSQPDMILSGFDIAANAAVTLTGAHMNIPVAHIQGGEVTGTIDESLRHSMTKFSHYHFAANEDACERLKKMGERPDSIFNVGCPSIDAMLTVKEDQNILSKFALVRPYFLLIQHPVTSEFHEVRDQIKITLASIKKSGCSVLAILPNNDAGYSSIMEEISLSGIPFVETLSISDYVNLLKNSTGLIGNSSSGIHESATFNIPTINIGSRQQGRLRGDNVIDVNHDTNQILSAIKKCINIKKKGVKFQNPYGDGNSAKKIVKLIKTLDLSQVIIQKRLTY